MLLDRVRSGLDLDAAFMTRILIALAMVETYQGEATSALAYLEEARSIANELDTRRRGTFLASLAQAYRQAGDMEAAIRSGLQAVALLRAAEAELEVGLVENHLALALLATGNAGRAREVADRARETTLASGDERLAAHVVDTQAAIALEMGDAERALDLTSEAIGLADASDNRKARLDAMVTRARTLAALKRGDEASAAFEEAAALARETAPPSRLRQILGAWADVLASIGRHDEAYALAREALATR
jgi:tetratricopeptide (TPR) repeat protein